MESIQVAQSTAANPALAEGGQVPLSVDLQGRLRCTTSGGASGGTSEVDESAFTEGGSSFTPSGGVYDDTLANLVAGVGAWFRITIKRALHINLRNATGTEIGTLTNPIRNQQVGINTTEIVDSGGNGVTVTGNKLDVNASVSIPANQTVDVNRIAGTATAVNTGNASAGTQRVVLATDQPTVPVSVASVPLPTGAATAAKQDTEIASLASIDGKITACNTGAIAGSVTANAGTNLNTSLLALESGGNLAGIVTRLGEVQASPTANTVLDRLKQLLTGIVLAASTNIIGKVGIDQTTPGTTNAVNVTALASGGATPYKYIAAASANQDSTVVKNSAGTIYGIAGFCTQASIRYVKIYDKATGPTSADTPVLTILIPGNASGAGAVWSVGIPGLVFANGISFRLNSGYADNDTGACTAGDCILDLGYK